MKKIKLIVLLAVIICLYNCEDKTPNYTNSTKLVTKNFELHLATAKDLKHLDRSHSFGVNNIQLNNTPLKEVLAIALGKDTSRIIIKHRNKKHNILKGCFKNLKEGATPQTTKEIFLSELKKYLNFSIEEVFPKNSFQLVVSDTILWATYKAKPSKSSKSIVFTSPSNKKLEVTTAKLSEISKGLTTIYKENIVSIQATDTNNRYSFTIENVPFDTLRDYLRENLGLRLVKLEDASTLKEEDRFVKIVFKE